MFLSVGLCGLCCNRFDSHVISFIVLLLLPSSMYCFDFFSVSLF